MFGKVFRCHIRLFLTRPRSIACLAVPTEPDGGLHTPSFRKAAATKEAHVAAVQIAKALAITGARILIDDDFMAEASSTRLYVGYPRTPAEAHP